MSHTEQIDALYRKLTKLNNSFSNKALCASQLQACLHFSDNLIAALKEHPDPVVAQLFYYKKSLGFANNFQFNFCLLTALIGLRNKVNESCIQQIVCAALSIYCQSLNVMNDYARGKRADFSGALHKGLKQFLLEKDFQVWLNAYQQSKWFYAAFKRTNLNPNLIAHSQKIIWVAHSLACLLTPRHQYKAISWPFALRQVAQNRSLTNILTPLMQYPTLYAPGSSVTLIDGRQATVSSIQTDQVVVANWYESDVQKIQAIQTARIANVQRPTIVSSMKDVKDSWNNDWEHFITASAQHAKATESSYKLNKPPEVILKVQALLNQTEVDVEQICHLIERESGLSDHLRETASQSNRQNIRITDVKHSLLIHGYDRTNNLLTQQALILRLNQHYFPLQQEFIQFTRLRAFITEQLFPRNAVLAQQAATLSCFASAGLFSCPGLKTLTRWQPRSQLKFDIAMLSSEKYTNVMSDNPTLLAQAWQQDRDLIAVLKHSVLTPQVTSLNKNQQLLTAAMGLSLVLSRELYLAEQINCERTKQYLDQAMLTLAIDATQLNNIKQIALASCQMSCPLKTA